MTLAALAVPAATPEAALTAWARSVAVPLDDDAAVLRTIGDPRVLALGEFTHGAHEPLALRNRLVRLLGERGRLNMVVVESGLVEGRRLNEYVMGGPGEATTVAAGYLNWGFGHYPENVELLRWLRAYNARPGVRRISLHGADIPGGNARAIGDASIAVADSIAWLRRVAPGKDEGLVDALTPYARDFDNKRWFALTPDERVALPRLADRLVALHARRRAEFGAATSADEEAWAERTAIVLRQIVGVFEAWPADNQAGNSPKGMFAVVQARDAAMAANALWLLRRAGSGAHMLMFMHNGHVEAAQTLPLLPGATQPYVVVGQRLRAALGSTMTVMLTNAVAGPPSTKRAANAPGSFGAALAAASTRATLVDLRRAPHSLALGRSWRMGANLFPMMTGTAAPREAADLIATFPATGDVVETQP